MILPLFRRLFSRKRGSTRSTPNQFRPELLVLEGRITPADIRWIGNGMGNGALWSVPANWHTNAVPGATDTAIFDALVGANTNSTMDLGGAGAAHVGKIITDNGYNKTITLNSDLWVDIFHVRSNPTFTGAAGKKLTINQTTNGNIKATLFGTSIWRGGTFQIPGGVRVQGEQLHLATLEIGSTINLNNDLRTFNQHATVKWTGGDINVAGGVKVENFGTFDADSFGGKMGNTAANGKWTFQNGGKLIVGSGKFQNTTVENQGQGAEFIKKVGLGPTDRFDIIGEFIQNAVASVSVESGTLYVDGPFTQSAGSVAVADGTTLEVTGAYDLSGGTVAVNGPVSASLTVGSFSQSGGTTTVQYATLTSAADIVVSGGTLTLSAGTLDAANDVEILSGGTLTGFGTVDVSSGILLNAGTITVGDSSASIGTLTVLGNYTQTGILNLKLYDSSQYDRLDVSGLATLGGTLNVTLASGASSPQLGSSYALVTYGSRSGTFATINRPPLSPPMYWGTTYGSNALDIWVGM